MGSKQVIVMKKFPKERNMRHGKYIAQGSHASVGSLFSIGHVDEKTNSFVIPLCNEFVKSWVTGSFKKVTCYVESDEDAVAIYEKAKALGMPCALIVDAGRTEFNGVPTITAVGIGPESEEFVDTVTGHLPLF